MRAEEKVLRIIYNLVKGDGSPVHLPVAPETICQTAGLPLERVQACCKVLENHGYVTSSRGINGPVYYYITKAGMAEAKKSNLSLYFFSQANPSRRRV
ncbi:hypothetical protein [Rufibacter quisquiliarum]|uniref:DNA-binding IclR family transcriptional regulator n=1 Tax=Rufibacter quisquiliarum TaxID=1549639 RepID=A0A839GKH0_9BACT|nr:hypothetical protein [Rufibacter quisquiliarum]MBA9079160.1 DNA-binding IclR family transcriptional regulator [Rufibacter quisquiliarum]